MEIIIAVLAVLVVDVVVVLAIVPTASRSLSLALMGVPLVVVVVIVVVVVVCDSFTAATCLRRPPTPIPSTPVRDGPKIVCECLRPVAPGNPEMLRGLAAPTEADPPPLPLSPSESSGESGGLEGSPSSGHFVVSAREAAAM